MRQLTIFDITPNSEPVTQILYPNPRQGQHLKQLAESLQPKIEALQNPPIAQLNPTPRRSRIVDAKYQEALKLKKLQAWLVAMSDAATRGDLDYSLSGISTIPQLSLFLWLTNPKTTNEHIRNIFINEHSEYDDYYKLLYRAKIRDYRTCKRAIAAIESLKLPLLEDPIAVKLRELERSLIGVKLIDYFPTPNDISKKLVALAQLNPNDIVLEPSAGCGHIARAIREAGAIPHCIEIDYTMRQILSLKRFDVVGNDFMEFWGQYKRIIMNPPFCEFISHIHHAYDDCLEEDGSLVAIVPESVFFRKESKFREFRKWMNERLVYEEKLAPGTFLSSDRPTGVHTRIIVLKK